MSPPVRPRRGGAERNETMTILAPTDTYAFEQWLLHNHPDLFDEWELEACEWLELDEWLWKEHYEVLDGWDRFRAANPDWRPNIDIERNGS